MCVCVCVCVYMYALYIVLTGLSEALRMRDDRVLNV